MQTERSIAAEDRLIVALDCPTTEQAWDVVTQIGPSVSFYKIGLRMFIAGGLEFVDRIRSQEKRIFLDLKIDDISETIETAVGELSGKVDLLTLMGGPATVKAAVAGRGSGLKPKLLSVTFLSSLDESDLRQMLPSELALPEHELLPKFIHQRARQALDAGADGLIASGDSVRQLRAALGPAPLIVTPGIRPSGAATNDQKRVKTPTQAIEEGSDLLVVGRPIWGAPSPKAAAEGIIEEISRAYAATAV